MMSNKDTELLEGTDEELVVQGPLERDWRGIVIALLVIIAMCSLILAAVLLFTPFNAGAQNNRTALTLTDLLTTTLASPVEGINWIDADRIIIQTIDDTKIINVSSNPPNIKSFSTEEIVARYGKINSIVFSYDTKYIVIEFDSMKKNRYRYSKWALYNIAKVPETPDESISFEPVGPKQIGDELVQLFEWGPSSNDYVFVHDNDLYYSDGPQATSTHRITNDSNELIYNGITDWVYEEEIFGSSKAVWWSRSGQFLAYTSLDDRKVEQIQYPIYESHQYPEINKIPYPKAGVPDLPVLSLYIWDKSSRISKKMNIDLKNQSFSTYIFSAEWIRMYDRDLLLAVFANRFQNITSITVCTFENGKCLLNKRQIYEFGGNKLWAEPDDLRIRYFNDNAYFVNLPTKKSNGNIYTQIAKVTVPNNLIDGRSIFYPIGDYDIASISGYNPKREELYFIAAAPKPSQRHLHSISISSPEKATCITCDLVPNCTFQGIIFSSDMDKFIMSCRGPGIPRIFVSSISSNNTFLIEVSESETLQKNYQEKALPIQEFENVTLKNGYVANVKLLLPPTLDKTALDQKFPVLVSVYAGPGSQKVLEENSLSFDNLAASNMKYVVVYIDGRGSGMRGWKYKEPIYGNFGTVEVDDQIEVIRILIKRHHYMDSRNIGIWGWSYGGFVSALVVERDEFHTFKCAVSVAPVTNFKFYDATYTERYMGDASDEAYERANVMRNVTNFKNVKYLLVHGTADDNVHLQNSADLIRALGEENVLFQLMIYPDASHGLEWSRMHLLTMLTDFFKKCFQS